MSNLLPEVMKSRSGQIVVEYLLLLVVATVIALLISSQMVSRNSEAPGFLIQQWNMIITTIGADYADDIER
tara:strand:+ start:326 stop:538 length:213 start_codon:yes stop_codon:yes gene_type:complete